MLLDVLHPQQVRQMEMQHAPPVVQKAFAVQKLFCNQPKADTSMLLRLMSSALQIVPMDRHAADMNPKGPHDP